MADSYEIDYNQIFENSKPYNYILDAYLIIIAITAGTLIGSLLIIISKNKWSNIKLDLKLSILMLLFDLGSSIISFIYAIANTLGYGGLLNTKQLCNFDALITMFFFGTSVSIVGVISLERCFLIVFNRKYSDKIYYIIILGFFLINIICWTEAWFLHGFELLPSSVYCLFHVKFIGGLVGSILTVASIGTSQNLIFITYTLICLYRRSQSQKAQIELGLDPKQVRKEVNSTIMKSLAIIIASALANIPYAVILIITWFDPTFLTPIIDMLQCMFVSSNILFNSVILINMKPELLKSLKVLWGFKTESS